MILTRTEILAKIEDRLAGRIDADALVAWSVDLFYDLEQGDAEVAEEDADAIAAVLDELMFADDERFALDEQDLRGLVARLQQP